MKIKTTLLVIGGLVMPAIVAIFGAIIANVHILGCTFGNVFILAPCWLVNTLLIALSIALIFDLLIYVILLKTNKRSDELSNWGELIKISPDIRSIREDSHKVAFGVNIINQGKDDLSDCFVDLERVKWAGVNKDSVWLTAGELGFRGRLGWLETSTQSSECKRKVESGNIGTTIKFAEEVDGELILRLCDSEFTLRKKEVGEFRLLIRVGGIYNGKPISPIFSAIRVDTEQRYDNKGIMVTANGTSPLAKREDFDEWNERWDVIYKDKKKAEHMFTFRNVPKTDFEGDTGEKEWKQKKQPESKQKRPGKRASGPKKNS